MSQRPSNVLTFNVRTPLRRNWPIILGPVILLPAVLVLAAEPILLGLGDFLIVRDNFQSADLIHALGGGFDRLDYAVELYRQGYGQRLFITRGDDAVIYRAYAVGKGAPAKDLWPLESKAESTTEEALELKQFLDNEVSIRSVIIVSNPYHMRRVHWTFQKMLGNQVTLQFVPVPPSAYVDKPCTIGAGTKIWHFCHVMQNARIGQGCILGQNIFVAGQVVIGDNVKIQNNVSLYTGVELEDDVFCGPSCVFTNVINPRSQILRHNQYQRTLVRRGATIGANATIVCGAMIGRYAFIGAGAVVRGDVPDYALMLGVPARRKGWMSRHGHRLVDSDAAGNLVCPESGWHYREVEPGLLRCLDWSEERPLAERELK